MRKNFAAKAPLDHMQQSFACQRQGAGGRSVAAPVVLYAIYYHGRAERSPPCAPQVKTLVPWLGAAFHIAWDFPKFVNESVHRYGRNFEVLVGGKRVVFVSDADALDSFYRNRSGELMNGVLHSPEPLRLLGDVQNPRAVEVIVSTLIPIIVGGNAEPSLCNITPRFNTRLFTSLTALASNGGDSLPLYTFVSQTLFRSILPAVFGPSFPLQTYEDFITVDDSTYQLFYRIPLLTSSVSQARRRMRDFLKKYMLPWRETGGRKDIDDVSGHANEVLRTLVALDDFTEEDQAGLLQTYIWGICTNLFRLTYWLFAHLLCDPHSYKRLREEIDRGVSDELGELSALLAAHPRVVNSGTFRLLDSAMKETGRVHLLPVSHRVARSDVELMSADGPFKVHRGSVVVANITSAHHDAAKFEDPRAFCLDRFVGGTGARSLYLWAKGSHICPGRHMATYYLKMFIVVCLRHFEVRPTREAPRLPDGHPWSTGLARPKNDILVTVRARAHAGEKDGSDE
ncbi:hypothetical protein ACG7TL_008538 [Trametes sanguinea]